MPLTMTLTNTCTCQYCESCELSYSYVESDECPECAAEMKFHDCYGYCYDETKEEALNFIADWVRANEAEYWVVDAIGMGWLRKNATSYVLTDIDKTFDALTLNTEWILRFTLDNNNLSVVRSSHDELGALFTLRKVEEDADE